MRGDYYVVPPNSAHVGRCVRESLACAHASGPDYIGGQVCPNICFRKYLGNSLILSRSLRLLLVLLRKTSISLGAAHQALVAAAQQPYLVSLLRSAQQTVTPKVTPVITQGPWAPKIYILRL